MSVNNNPRLSKKYFGILFIGLLIWLYLGYRKSNNVTLKENIPVTEIQYNGRPPSGEIDFKNDSL